MEGDSLSPDCQRIGICENLVVVAVLFVHMLVDSYAFSGGVIVGA